jgi:hypothetical protein
VSSPLAIGAVSAVLRNLLDNGIVDVGVPIGSVKVTAVAPDTIDLDDAGAGPSLNVFLYRVSRNIGWENAALPSRDSNGNRISNQPLALDLHYLITAYGQDDFEAEILLGYAMHLLHERPLLDRASIRRALNPSPLDSAILPPAFQALTASDLAKQIESVTITQEPIDTEEMSRLWAAIQTHFRPSAGYVATVVLIEARKPSKKGLPVLSRGTVDLVTGRDRGPIATPDLIPPFATIERVAPPGGQTAALLGDTVDLVGHHLDGTGLVVGFAHRLLDTPHQIAVGANTDPGAVSVIIPSTPAAEQDWPAGLYTVTLDLIRPGEATPRRSNAGAMFLAPEPALPPAAIARDLATQRVSVTLSVSPQLRPEQEALLSLGSHTARVEPHPLATFSLDFEFGVVPSGAQWVRLTVDGAESLLVDHTQTPPVFDPAHSVTVPA